jgi:hypothetical protein
VQSIFAVVTGMGASPTLGEVDNDKGRQGWQRTQISVRRR